MVIQSFTPDDISLPGAVINLLRGRLACLQQAGINKPDNPDISQLLIAMLSNPETVKQGGRLDLKTGRLLKVAATRGHLRPSIPR